MNVLVTGSNGFIGRNLVAWLGRLPEVRVLGFDLENTPQELAEALAEADFVYHLAGVNRPQSEDEFRTGNVDLPAQVCNGLLALGKATPIVLSSSVQAALDNPYGVSKRQAEAVIADYAARSSAHVIIYRLKNVFGKWCRPNYNSVVATFCYNISHDLEISISEPSRVLELAYIDDVVRALTGELMDEVRAKGPGGEREVNKRVAPVYSITLGELAETIRSFKGIRHSLVLPDLGGSLVQKLYGTYLSYLEPDDLSYDLDVRSDHRGMLAEFIKSEKSGQIFVSRTAPGITRGQHYHDTKAEKFLVVEGEGIIRLRHVLSANILEHRVSGGKFQVLEIPPGYTHSIENVGSGELVTLFWASQVFDKDYPDTYGENV